MNPFQSAKDMLTFGSLTLTSPAASVLLVAVGTGGTSLGAVAEPVAAAGTREVDLAVAAHRPGS